MWWQISANSPTSAQRGTVTSTAPCFVNGVDLGAGTLAGVIIKDGNNYQYGEGSKAIKFTANPIEDSVLSIFESPSNYTNIFGGMQSFTLGSGVYNFSSTVDIPCALPWYARVSVSVTGTNGVALTGTALVYDRCKLYLVTDTATPGVGPDGWDPGGAVCLIDHGTWNPLYNASITTKTNVAIPVYGAWMVTASGTSLRAGNFINIQAYYNSSDEEHLTKSLSVPYGMSGQLRAPWNIETPVIQIEFTGVFTYNYIRVDRFSRYYYVRRKTLINYNIWELQLEVDVLMSNKTQISEQEALISRSESSFNSLLIDSQDVMEANTLTLTAGLTVSVNYNWWNTTPALGMTPLCVSILTDNGVESFLMTPANFSNLVKDLQNPDFITAISRFFTDGSQYIVNVVKYEFDIVAFSQQTQNTINITIAGFAVSLRGIVVATAAKNTPYYLEFVQLNQLHPLNNTNFRYAQFSPYSSYKLYLPYVGIVDLDTDKFVNAGLKVRYTIDIATGEALVTVQSTAHSESYYHSCNMSTPYLWGGTETSTNTFGALSAAIGGAATVAATASTGGAFPIAAVASTGLGVVSAQKVSPTYTGTLSGKAKTFAGKTPMLIITYPNIDTQAASDALSYRGRPLMQSKVIGELEGFVQCADVHLDGYTTLTLSEKEKLRGLLLSGIIV